MRENEFIAVSGVGGSGTRIIAELLQRTGYYIGPVQNKALDCLLFSLLFRRPAWFEAFPADDEIHLAADTFIAAMQGGLEPQVAAFGAANFERLLTDLKTFPRPTGLSPQEIRAIRAASAPTLESYVGLAWKEPNTHIFLPQLARRFPRLKFVHVIRNGLDMALSENLYQLRNWGKFLGVERQDDEPLERTQLRFWLAANQRVVDFGSAHMADRFLLINYDALCENSEREITRLIGFLGEHRLEQPISELAALVAPTSRNRFRFAQLNLFSDEERAAVRAFGFKVD